MLKLRQLLSRAESRRSAKGQIATFIIILMVVVFVLSMFITNMGQLSTTTITVANAVDASALGLASQLATTANTICAQLSDPEGTCSAGNDGIQRCRRTGLLGIFLAVITVIAVAIITAGIGTMAAPAILAAWGAGAGAVGGAIATHSWSGTLMGAAAGAAIGFGLGAGFSAPAAMSGGTAAGTGGLATGSLTATTTAAGVLVPAGTMTGTAIAGGIAAFSLSALGSGYTQSRMDHSARVGIDSLSQSLTGLPEYERMRESVLLNALNLAVDDPNMTVGPGGGSGCYFPGPYGAAVGDPFDFDGDGDTTESIACVNYWWSVRVNQLRLAFASRADLVRRYIEGPWNGEPSAGTLRDRRDKARSILHYLERHEVECQCQPLGPVPSEGATVEYFRRVDAAGYSYPAIFQPGPDQAALRAFLDDPTDTAPTPAGWDSLDAVQYLYKDFLAWADSIVYSPILQGQCGLAGTPGDWYNRLAQTTDSWVPMLYDPNSTEDYYDQLGFIMGEMGGWFLTGREIARNSPPCHLAYGDYPPIFSSRQDDPPFCANTIIVTDPNSCPVDQDEDPIDSCTNVNNSTPANLVTGAHLANMDFDPDFTATFPVGPMCRIDLTHKTELVRQMDIIEPFVQNPTFQNFIQANYATHFDSPLPTCDAPPAGPPPPPSCTIAGDPCSADGQCCSNSCNVCSLGRDGNSCTNNNECCSDDCNTCSATPVGGACAVDGDCCSNFCDPGLGTCGGSDPAGSCNGDGPSDSCNGPDPAPPQWVVRLVTLPQDMTVVTIDEVALEKWPAGSPDRLDYTYTFQFECELCVLYDGVTTCDPATRYWWTNQRSKFYPDDGSPLDTPDLKVVRQVTGGGQTGQENFVAALAQMRLILTTLRANLDDFRHVYATTDADPGGIFNPAIGGGTEGADAAGGEPFINHSEPYLFDPGTGSWVGTAALEYFLLQVVDFWTQLQNILGVPPAVDGRLPNPLQVIGDPIRGGVRVVDGFYEWEDSQGVHSVNVEIGPFIKPTTVTYKTGNWLVGKKCVEMINHCDNTPGCRHQTAAPNGRPLSFIGPDRTWVRITRRDPTNRQIGLWNWNPFAGTIRKTARAAYGRRHVSICGTSGGDCPQ